jgi:zinc protease
MLAGGRSSLLAGELMDSRRSAATVTLVDAFPGARSPHLFTIVVTVAPGHTPEENEGGIAAVLARLQTEPVDEAALARAKSHIRSAMVRRLADNSSIANTLVAYAAEQGDWRKAFAAADAISKVTAAQVQIAAAKYLVPSRRTTVLMVPPAPVPAAPAKGAAK